MNTFGGMPITVSPYATQLEPRFPDKPDTKRRRRRVIGKYGSWETPKPCMYQVGGRLVIHPKAYALLLDRVARDSGTYHGL